MRLVLNIALMAMLAICISGEEGWSWINKDSSKPENSNINYEEEEQETAASDFIEQEVKINSTEADKIIDHILVSTREGKSLDGFDEVYSDPNIQEVLQKGDENQARNIIKDRLCHLGLMDCGDDVKGKRPYISPEELIYAQPVAINPVGRPIPTIPIKGPVRGSYGPNKAYLHGPPPPNKFGPPPSHFGPPPHHFGPPSNNFGPPPHKFGPPPNKPPRRGYGSQPVFSKPSPFGPTRPYPGEIFEGQDSLIEPDSPPYKYQSISETAHKDKKVEVVVNAQGSGQPGGVQQHVHHHFHHNGETPVKQLPVVINPIPIVSAAAVSGSQSSSHYDSSTSGFNPISGSHSGGLPIGGFGGSYGGQTIANYGSSNHGLGQSSFKPVNENYGPQNFGSNSFGTSVGSYGSSGLYKKQLNLFSNSVNSNYLQPSYADKYQGLESVRGENYDCVCVPYDQCPSHEVIGRKDDLYLPLDPRNLKTDIEALDVDERVITDANGTMTIVRIPKQTNLNDTKIEENKNSNKSVTKREAPSENKDDNKSDVKTRQFGGDINKKKISPTFGVSFSLPNQGGGGYPINPYGPNPFVNPYGGSIGNQGINLGLVSVNPLISLQVTKDDYGEKIIKPFVNLHVTPNNYLVHKFEDLLSYKKAIVFNKHKHFHYHKPHGHSYSEPHFQSGPIHYERPEFEGPPIHNPHFQPSEEAYYPQHSSYYDEPLNYGGGNYDDTFTGRSHNFSDLAEGNNLLNQYSKQFNNDETSYGLNDRQINLKKSSLRRGKTLFTPPNPIKFPTDRKRRDLTKIDNLTKRQAIYGGNFGRPQTCGPRHVCCRRPIRPQIPNLGGNQGQCGIRHSQGINGRIKNPVYVDGDSEFGEYPWQVAILKKDSKESVYICGGTLIDPLHILTAAHCVKAYSGLDLRVRLGEWDVNHDVEFFPYIERDIININVHPEFYAGTLYNDIALLRMDKPVDFTKYPHISPACLPQPQDDYTHARCWTTGWGKDAFGDFGKYQNILKEVDVPIINHGLCQSQLQQTRLGYEFQLHPGFICAGGEEGKDACKGDGGGPMVCEKGGTWQVVGVVSWGIGCGQVGIPGVYVKVSQYLDWIRQIIQRY